jgi:hypothetical protein
MRVFRVTLQNALELRRTGQELTLDWVEESEAKWRNVLNVGGPGAIELDRDGGNPFDEIDVTIRSGVLYRDLPDLVVLTSSRQQAISAIIEECLARDPSTVDNVVNLLADCMLHRQVVRVVGAGRALLAAALPANRLAHGGAMVFILGDRTPFPNSSQGGVVLAASASGKTEAVLRILEQARDANEYRGRFRGTTMTVVGVANSAAAQFRALCSPGYFVGMTPERSVKNLELRALGDIEEFAISELLDALVVAAGLRIGVVFRSGHEDLGPTGPWHQYDSGSEMRSNGPAE